MVVFRQDEVLGGVVQETHCSSCLHYAVQPLSLNASFFFQVWVHSEQQAVSYSVGLWRF